MVVAKPLPISSADVARICDVAGLHQKTVRRAYLRGAKSVRPGGLARLQRACVAFGLPTPPDEVEQADAR